MKISSNNRELSPVRKTNVQQLYNNGDAGETRPGLHPGGRAGGRSSTLLPDGSRAGHRTEQDTAPERCPGLAGLPQPTSILTPGRTRGPQLAEV